MLPLYLGVAGGRFGFSQLGNNVSVCALCALGLKLGLGLGFGVMARVRVRVRVHLTFAPSKP